MADQNEPNLDEKDVTAALEVRKGFDYLQLGFWAALTLAGGAAGMALTWFARSGASG